MPDTIPCRILFLEDDEQDVELMKQDLNLAHFSHTSIQIFTKKEFIDALHDFNPDVILADYSLPMFNGMHAFRLFKEQNLAIPFILVTGELSDQVASDCLNEGIDDYVLKSSFKRLPSVLKRNLEIKKAQIEKERLAAELEKKNEELRALKEKAEQEKAHELLSNREFEILCLIAQDKSVKEIGAILYLSPATVATYRARILEKMGLRSNVDITRYALHHKLIE